MTALRRPWLLLLLAGLPALAAQDDAGGKPTTPELRQSAIRWSEAQSRRLFAGADGNADDRLDLFEAASALDSIGSPKEREVFRRLDRNRDGYVNWPEFDAHFRDLVEHGGTLRVRMARPMPPIDDQGEAEASPARRLLRLWDTDGSGDLSEAELRAMLQGLGAPPAVQARPPRLDQDGSGTVSEAELAPVLQLVPGLAGAGGPKGSRLPLPWRQADADQDGSLSLAEFTDALRRLDPTLAAWAARLLRRADQNGDGKLDEAELALLAKTAPAR